MGTVYLVQHPTLPRQEALKLLEGVICRDKEFRARFTREADLLAGLSHPNIVTLHNRGESDDGRLWLTMEYVDGVDAAALIRDQGPIAFEVALPVLSGAAAALDYAYQRRSITHRDVKPANILVTFHEGEVDQVKLADFGIAKAVGESTNLTSTGLTVGTMSFISPEAISDSTNITGAADQYSLAATAYALLTGSGPFTSVGAPALMYDHINSPVPDISSRRRDIPRAADSVFAQALAKSPQSRYGSCAEFVTALASAIAANPMPDNLPKTLPRQDATTIHRPSPVMPKLSAPTIKQGVDSGVITPPGRKVRNGRVRNAFLALTLIVAMGAALLVWRPWTRTEMPQATALGSYLATPVRIDTGGKSLVYYLNGSKRAIDTETGGAVDVASMAGCEKGPTPSIASSASGRTTMRICNVSLRLMNTAVGTEEYLYEFRGGGNASHHLLAISADGGIAYIGRYDSAILRYDVNRRAMLEPWSLPVLGASVEQMVTNSNTRSYFARTDDAVPFVAEGSLDTGVSKQLSLGGLVSKFLLSSDGAHLFALVRPDKKTASNARFVSWNVSSRRIDYQSAAANYDDFDISEARNLVALVSKNRSSMDFLNLSDGAHTSSSSFPTIYDFEESPNVIFSPNGRKVFVGTGSEGGANADIYSVPSP
ncbi:hypothetical protein TSOC111612_22725 [Tsukamurella ocularis]